MKISEARMKVQPCEMHICLRNAIQICRWAGFFPIEGLNSPTMYQLRFNLKSLYSLYSFTSLIFLFVVTGYSFKFFINNDLSLETLSIFIFYITSLGAAIFLLILARHWPELIRKVADLEYSVKSIRISKNAPWKYNFAVYFVLLLALVEHALSVSYNMHVVMNCKRIDKINSYAIEEYYKKAVAFFFTSKTCPYWKIFMFEMTNIQATFLWNFTDVMMMCVSMYLISYFQDLNKFMKLYKDKNTFSWSDIRIYFSSLVMLVKEVDSKLCYLILLSFFTNLYFICYQLFNTLNYSYTDIETCDDEADKIFYNRVIYFIYYMYSLLFLIVRAAIMSILAANVNRVAREPISTLLYVPSSQYSLDIQRFNRQLRYTTTALSGVLFNITRETLLKVVGTIITYELVLLQFGQRNDINNETIQDILNVTSSSPVL